MMKKTTKNIEPEESNTAASWAKCPMCGKMAFGWVYMLHFTLGCETAKRY